MTHAHQLSLLLTLSALLGAGCAADVDSEIGVAAQYDPRGDVSQHDWVVAVSHTDADGEHHFCTGVVVGPYTVVTQPSCVPHAPLSTSIMTGPDARYADRVEVAGAIVDESEQLAVLMTDEPLATTVAELSERSLRDVTEATVIGYGASGRLASVLGLKRELEMTVSEGALFNDQVALCFGDLGAPIVDADGRLLGFVTALGATCAAPTPATGRSIDSARQLIDAVAEIVPGG